MKFPQIAKLSFDDFFALTEELDHLTITAPLGTIFDACETAVLIGGRDVQQQTLEQAVARRVIAAEKKVPLLQCACGGPKENRGSKTRQSVSAVGVMPLGRRYWQCRCGEPGSYAVDELFGIEGRLT